jgi:hypothetical protein
MTNFNFRNSFFGFHIKLFKDVDRYAASEHLPGS